MSTLNRSQNPALNPDSPIELIVPSRERDLGGFSVKRVLPYAKKRMVGPFIFLDEMGPLEILSEQAIDVRPHPHIGLSTLTYLFEGSMWHRDSLGVEMEILPGDVNWMTAGRGVAHSERSGKDARENGQTVSGLQAWVALPEASEESDPGFEHQARSALPMIEAEGATIRLVAGKAHDKTSPLAISSPLIYADIVLQAGTMLPVDPDYSERALYLLSGEIEIDGQAHGPHALLVLKEGLTVTVKATRASRMILLGGEPLEGPRHIWWNFVSSSKERIEQAKEDWRRQRFDKVINDTVEFTPLPEDR